ncbi:hypothetical protein AAD018_013485 [Aestuariibius insulae]|uniref:hypothetical protein n=1 Tax=Aestuariibius insulae TaxID=2058287 RepID=UPI00398F0346
MREAYRIEGIAASECRSIFLDWVLTVPDGEAVRPRIETLLMSYGIVEPDHPMTQVLRDGLGAMAEPRRRGGRRARTGE